VFNNSISGIIFVGVLGDVVTKITLLSILAIDKDIFEMADKDDFMFLDPPYDCVFSDYGNVEYKDGFNEKNHIELANQYKTLKCKALMVIGRTPLTERLYGDFIVEEYGKSYAVNIRNRFKSAASHILVSNYGNEALKQELKPILKEESVSYG
jgi:DNA adenine methylase